MLRHYLIVIRNSLSCSNPSLLLIWTEPINIESPRFQCQLKLESVTFFSVSHFLLHTETCVGRTQRCTGPDISICEPGANNEQHCPKNWNLPVRDGASTLLLVVTHQRNAPLCYSHTTWYHCALVTHSSPKHSEVSGFRTWRLWPRLGGHAV